MLAFPREHERSADIATNLAREFDFADRLYEEWLTTRKRPSDSQLPEAALYLGILLNTQTIRLFRSIVDDCRRGEAFCANIMSRSLYETALAIIFLLKPQIGIVAEKELKTNGKPALDHGLPKYKVRITDDPTLIAHASPSIKTRAYLYLVRMIFSDQHLFQKMESIPDLAEEGRLGASRFDPKAVAALTSNLTDDWLYILKHKPFTYSGLSISDLTRVLDPSLHDWYKVVYHVHSGMVHAGDAARHGGPGEDGQFQPIFISSDEEVRGALQAATMILLVCTISFQNYVGFGQETEDAINGFAQEFHELYPTPVAPPSK